MIKSTIALFLVLLPLIAAFTPQQQSARAFRTLNMAPPEPYPDAIPEGYEGPLSELAVEPPVSEEIMSGTVKWCTLPSDIIIGKSVLHTFPISQTPETLGLDGCLMNKQIRFNTIKGFGFIQPDGGGDDLFVHQTAIKAQGFRSLADGERVEYRLANDDIGRKRAVEVTGPGGANVQGAPFRPEQDYGGAF
eukprot:CAMPEP_0116855766 /NCGR_PEP_ID=MMETSP0418-20121206/19484_1 /TAXON_ID=1158023 /ORGANISM="Astrosyne radiata, Strain 13vi08-1A" /LENGTH=190 /DNA_ID=CAMNT_0004488983 /DNA_START=37 /DNA_END=609 /DNA_ORIENTATION=-